MDGSDFKFANILDSNEDKNVKKTDFKKPKKDDQSINDANEMKNGCKLDKTSETEFNNQMINIVKKNDSDLFNNQTTNLQYPKSDKFQYLHNQKSNADFPNPDQPHFHFDKILADVECTHDGSFKHILKYIENQIRNEKPQNPKSNESDRKTDKKISKKEKKRREKQKKATQKSNIIRKRMDK